MVVSSSEVMFCPTCGAERRDGAARFCASCGRELAVRPAAPKVTANGGSAITMELTAAGVALVVVAAVLTFREQLPFGTASDGAGVSYGVAQPVGPARTLDVAATATAAAVETCAKATEAVYARHRKLFDLLNLRLGPSKILCVGRDNQGALVSVTWFWDQKPRGAIYSVSDRGQVRAGDDNALILDTVADLGPAEIMKAFGSKLLGG